MNKKFKSMAVTIALVGMTLSAAIPVLAQGNAPGGEIALVDDMSWMGQPVLDHPRAHVSGAEQLKRVYGPNTFVPEASLHLSEHVDQESGASQLQRVYGANVFIPEAALYLGEWMPRAGRNVIK